MYSARTAAAAAKIAVRIAAAVITLWLGMAVAQMPSVTPPLPVDDPTLTAAQLALLATATAGNICNAGPHVQCAVNTLGTNQNNGNGLMTAFHNAASSIAAGTTPTAEIIVMTHNDGATNHQYEHSGTNSGACKGNNTPSISENGCDFYFDTLVQADPLHVKPIIFVTDHYGNLPNQYTRLVPVTNTDGGFTSPAGQVANVSPSDLATMQTVSNSNVLVFFSQNGLDGIRFIGVEFKNVGTIKAFSAFQNGTGAALAYTMGAGETGARALTILDGGGPGYTNQLAQAIRIDTGWPTITAEHVVSATPCTRSWTPYMTPSVANLVCFEALNTHFVAGQSMLSLYFNGHPALATDVVVNSLAAGTASGQCAAGATQAGNGVLGNLCVTDSTHAYTSITPSLTTPANGGVHSFAIDTVPAGATGTYAAGTERAVTDDALIVTYPQVWTLTCTGCPQATIASGPSAGQVPVPSNGQVFKYTAQGTVSGPGATNWTTSHRLMLGVSGATQFLWCTGTDAPTTGCFAPDLSGIANQTIVGYFSVIQGRPASRNTSIVTAGGFGQGQVSTVGETDVLYKNTQTSLYANGPEGIDYCSINGSTRYYINYVTRGSTYTLTCYGMNTQWVSTMNCSGNCSAANVSLGSGVTVNSMTISSPTLLTLNITLSSVVEQGAKHIVFDRVWMHGDDGQIWNTSSVPPSSMVACNQNGTMINNSCYNVNAQDISDGAIICGAHNVFINSYVNAIHNALLDSIGIACAYGDGPVLIYNNFISATTENLFMGGGAGQASINSVGTLHDVTMQHNYLYKPPAWYNIGLGEYSGHQCTNAINTTPSGSRYYCVYSLKDDWESKGCTRCLLDSNVMENNWFGAIRTYAAINFTPREAFFQGVTSNNNNDFTISNNLLVGVANGLLDGDYDTNVGYSTSGGPDPTVSNGTLPTLQSRRTVINNNLFIVNQTGNTTNAQNIYAAELNVVMADQVYNHNTFLGTTGLVLNTAGAVLGGLYYSAFLGASCTDPLSQQSTNNFWFINNVVYQGQGGTSGCTSNQLSPNPTTPPNAFNNRFAGNVMPKPGIGSFPTTTFSGTLSTPQPQVASSMANVYPLLSNSVPFSADYTLTGPVELTNWIGTGNANTTDGTTAGVNMSILKAFVNYVVKGVPISATNTTLAPGLVVTPGSIYQ